MFDILSFVFFLFVFDIFSFVFFLVVLAYMLVDIITDFK